ncbi:MAG: hypothetical protein ACFE9S_04515 [Candidatus Hermodarchaeota archaeon]
MFEFCENCGGMLLPSKDKNKKILICKSCGEIEILDEKSIESYIFHTEIQHPLEKEL